MTDKAIIAVGGKPGRMEFSLISSQSGSIPCFEKKQLIPALLQMLVTER